MGITVSSHRNVVIVVGEILNSPTVTELEDGRIFATFDMLSRVEGARTVVPVTVDRPVELTIGDPVAVLGRVEKRFFRSGPSTTTRTDVRAEYVAIIRRPSQLARFLSRSSRRLGTQ